MDSETIRAKFGDRYAATDRTFRMGIDQRLSSRLAERFRNRTVLETCTGAGFTTIALARVARRVITVEIDPHHQAQARNNLEKAGLLDRVTLILGDILDEQLWVGLPAADAALLDPDWAVTEPEDEHRFVLSSTQPPADALLPRVLRATPNVALVLPPRLEFHELVALPALERQKLYLNDNHELYCLYFGDLGFTTGETELRV